MRERLMAGAALAMEALWVYAAASLVAGYSGGGRAPSAVALSAAAALGFGLARALRHLDFGTGALRAAWTAGTVVGVVALVRLDYAGDLRLWDAGWARALLAESGEVLARDGDVAIGAAAVLGLWVRSGLRGLGTLTWGSVLASFSVGFAVMTFVLAAGPLFEPEPRIGWVGVPFFALGLLALALGQGRELDRAAEAPARREWAATLAAVVGGLALLAGAAALLPRLGARSLLLPAADAALWAVNLVLLAVAYPLVWVMSLVIRLLLSLMGQGEPFEPELPEQVLEPGRNEGMAPAWLEVLTFLLQAAVLVGIALLVVLVVAWLFRRLFAQRPESGGPEETTAGEGSLGEDLRALWRGMASRFRRGGRVGEPDLPPGARRVRALYLRMLRRAADEGLERPEGRTPAEFSPLLEAHFESAVPGEVTEAFVAARYGAREPEAAAVDDLERRWSGVRGRG